MGGSSRFLRCGMQNNTAFGFFPSQQQPDTSLSGVTGFANDAYFFQNIAPFTDGGLGFASSSYQNTNGFAQHEVFSGSYPGFTDTQVLAPVFNNLPATGTFLTQTNHIDIMGSHNINSRAFQSSIPPQTTVPQTQSTYPLPKPFSSHINPFPLSQTFAAMNLTPTLTSTTASTRQPSAAAAQYSSYMQEMTKSLHKPSQPVVSPTTTPNLATTEFLQQMNMTSNYPPSPPQDRPASVSPPVPESGKPRSYADALKKAGSASSIVTTSLSGTPATCVSPTPVVAVTSLSPVQSPVPSPASAPSQPPLQHPLTPTVVAAPPPISISTPTPTPASISNSTYSTPPAISVPAVTNVPTLVIQSQLPQPPQPSQPSTVKAPLQPSTSKATPTTLPTTSAGGTSKDMSEEAQKADLRGSALLKEAAQRAKTTDLNPAYARCFVIKSYSEDDIHKCVKYGVWASTDIGNRRLDTAYHEAKGRGPVYLFFSVNSSGQFCGMARMTSPLDYDRTFGAWAQDKWSGEFTVEWIFIKDIPNKAFRHIILPNNENKPVTNSRDTQEIPFPQAKEMLRIFQQHSSKTSILDDFAMYDDRETLMEKRRKEEGSGPTRRARKNGVNSAVNSAHTEATNRLTKIQH
eukprot:c8320_g2_i1.p1 GENE.c8320_g2_i1~~c8320_g2_i1.p1  ORF type:complete len:630 (-),score=131.65 c8320_g2_i1:150-2039(-)